MWIIEAWVRNSPNTAPIATAMFRSFTLAQATKKLWEKDFRVTWHAGRKVEQES